jgi:hypothetical protein
MIDLNYKGHKFENYIIWNDHKCFICGTRINYNSIYDEYNLIDNFGLFSNYPILTCEESIIKNIIE